METLREKIKVALSGYSDEAAISAMLIEMGERGEKMDAGRWGNIYRLSQHDRRVRERAEIPHV